MISLRDGLSQRNMYEMSRVIQIHTNHNKIEIERPRCFITTSDKNHDIHQKEASDLVYQYLLLAHLRSYIC
jgi:hypothetical protein